MEVSLYALAKRLSTDVMRVLARVDAAELAASERQAIASLKAISRDARLDVRDYEYAETRTGQVRCAADGRKRLADLRDGILKASVYGIFSGVEVAKMTAEIDRIIDELV